MHFVAELAYPTSERPQAHSIGDLLEAWYAALPPDLANGFVPDGFYPFYRKQRFRILFVGREARDLAGCNYLEVLHEAYRKTKRIGDRSLSHDHYHYRMLCIAWGLLNEQPIWRDIPPPLRSAMTSPLTRESVSHT